MLYSLRLAPLERRAQLLAGRPRFGKLRLTSRRELALLLEFPLACGEGGAELLDLRRARGCLLALLRQLGRARLQRTVQPFDLGGVRVDRGARLRQLRFAREGERALVLELAL